MATISNQPRPGYAWDATDNVWYPIGTGTHGHPDYITQATAISPTLVDAKGDIIAASAADTVARLAVGANDTVLTADSSTATGLKWAAPSSGGMTSLATGTLSGSTITLSSISGSYIHLYLVIKGAYQVAGSQIVYQFNGSTAGNYWYSRLPFSTNSISGVTGQTGFRCDSVSNPSVANNNTNTLFIENYALTGSYKVCTARAATDTGAISWGGDASLSGAVTSISITSSGASSYSGGTYTLYGVK